MKRSVLTAVFLLAVAALGGCPIYDHDDDGCYESSDCAPGYACDQHSGDCYPPSGITNCIRPSDCGVNETCAPNGTCVSGDCSFSGCVRGYECDSSSGIWACIVNGSATGSGGAGAEGGASSGAAAGGASAADSGAADAGAPGAAGTAASAVAGAAGQAGGG